MCQIVVPVPIFTFQGYRSFIYIIPLGLSVFVIRSLLIKKVEEPPFEGAIKNGKIEKNTAMLKGVVALFFFIIVLNYLRTGVDIYMISKGINFIVFNNMVLVPCFLCFFMSMLCKTTKDLKVILLFMAGGGILILFDSIMRYLGYSIGIVSLRGQVGQIFTDSASTSYLRFGQMTLGALYLFPLALAFLRNWMYKYGICGFLLLLAALSGGRITTFSLLFILMLDIFFWMSKIRLIHKVFFVILAFALGLVLMSSEVLKVEDVNRINQRTFGANYLKDAFQGRMAVYHKSFQLFLTNPFIGVGPMDQNTDARITKKFGQSSAEYLARQGTHCMYANLLAINGFFAFFIYVSFNILIIKTLSHSYFMHVETFIGKFSLMLLFFFISASIRHLFEGNAEGGDWYFYLNMGLFFALLDIIRKGQTLEKEDVTKA
jgi:hypothetical protein